MMTSADGGQTAVASDRAPSVAMPTQAAMTPAPLLASTPEPPAATLPPPVRVLIPSLGIDASVEAVGVDAAGAMATPHDIWNVGWFSPGPAPGAPGDAVVDGHLGLPGYPLIFNRLGSLKVGDPIRVTDADGVTRDFTVSSSNTWPATSHPLGLFDTAGPPRLSLITCDGAYRPSSQTYADRLVVEADLSGVETR